MATAKELLLAKLRAKQNKNSQGTIAPSNSEDKQSEIKDNETSQTETDKVSEEKTELVAHNKSSESDKKNTSVVQTNGIDPVYEPLKMKLAELEQSLEHEVPGFAFLLRDIHQTMRADPNVVTILTDDEIGLVVRGLEKNLNLTIVPVKATGKSRSNARTQPISADDL